MTRGLLLLSLLVGAQGGIVATPSTPIEIVAHGGPLFSFIARKDGRAVPLLPGNGQRPDEIVIVSGPYRCGRVADVMTCRSVQAGQPAITIPLAQAEHG